MRRQLFPALRILLMLTVVTGILYPLAVLAIGQGVFADRADGSLVRRDGQVVGSSLLGQSFAKPRYFHPRPSAAGDGYDGAASSASNLGPSNPDLAAAVKDRVAQYKKENGLAADAKVPVDAVTASGSGLDPDISVANARVQAARVATARGLDADAVRTLVDDHVNDRQLGVLGEESVNVLNLNLALDLLPSP
ncbi:MAG: K(+)-transporting ATPase subunit C [Acidimicrobiia bacterium]